MGNGDQSLSAGAVGNGEDQKSYDGIMIVGGSLQQRLKPRGRSITAGTLSALRRGYMKSRGMVTRTPRRGWLWRRSRKAAMSAHSARRRMVESWLCAPVRPTVQAVRGQAAWNDRVHPATERICGGVGGSGGVRDLTSAF